MSTIVKLSVKEQAVLRNDLYSNIQESMETLGFTVEPVADGMLIHLDNAFAEVKVAIKNPEKFDLEAARIKYAEKVQRQAERAEKSARLAQEKAEKAAAKLAKEQADA